MKIGKLPHKNKLSSIRIYFRFIDNVEDNVINEKSVVLLKIKMTKNQRISAHQLPPVKTLNNSASSR